MDFAKIFNNKKVLITGGLGFIGSNLAHKLVKLGSDVTLVDLLIPAYGGNMFNISGIKNKLKINIADIADLRTINAFIKDKNYLFNFAGISSHLDSITDPYADLDINCRAQLTILEACRKFNKDVKIVFLGTRGEYGKAKYLPVDENHPIDPVDINGINKRAGEMYHILYSNIYKIRACSLRLTNTYGPRHQMKNFKQGFLNWFIRLAIDDDVIKIYGDGKTLRDFNYIDDVVEAILMVATDERSNGKIFNLGSGSPISILDAAKSIINITKKGRIRHIAFPEILEKIEVGDYCAGYSKIKNLLGWQPKVCLQNGLISTVDYYVKNKKYYWS